MKDITLRRIWENGIQWRRGNKCKAKKKKVFDEAIKRFGALLSTGLIGGIVGNEARKVGRRHDSIEIP